MDPLDSRIANWLLEQGHLDQFQYQSAKDHMSQYGGKFHMVAAQLGLVHEETLAKGLSRFTGVQVVSLVKIRKDPQALALLPGEFCMERHVFPCGLRDNGTTLWLAMADPTDIKTRTEVQMRTRLKIRPMVGPLGEIHEAIKREYFAEAQNQIPLNADALDMTLPSVDQEFKVFDLKDQPAVRKAKQVEAPDSSRLAPDRRKDLERWADHLLANLDKGERIIRGIYQLCIEKGFFSVEEYQKKMTK